MADTDLDTFRGEVASWFRDHAPKEWNRRSREMDPGRYREALLEWLAALNTKGFAAPALDPEWGGGGFGAREQTIIYEEWARADAPGLEAFIVSLHHVPSTFLMAGTPEQQQRFIPAAIRGEGWCQGFSEPGSGSDLASLRLPATRVEGGWEVSGQKIWSTNADTAKWCLLLARTDPDSAGAAGITYFVLDMEAPGVEVRPIRQNTGYQEYCEIFLDRVHIPDGDVIGEVGQGWAVAQRTLTAERGPLGFDLLVRISVALERQAAVIDRDGASTALRARLADLQDRVTLARALALDAVDALEDAGNSGSLASLLKLTFSELLHDVTDFATVASGTASLIATGDPHFRGFVGGGPMTDWLGSWGWTISAGTNEIQRTIIAEKILGLPREPRIRAASGATR